MPNEGQSTSVPEEDSSMMDEIREAVQARYADAARSSQVDAPAACCCAGGCATDDDLSEKAKNFISRGLYTDEELQGLPLAAHLASLGCGNPAALAQLHPGEVVLDLGSGGGIDVLLSARRVGPTGFAYGLDMTDEMLELAEKNRAEACMENVKFLKGQIEDIPMPDATVDVIISNCVINLSGDKDRVLREAFRVLKLGGRLAVSDAVVDGTLGLPDGMRDNLQAWSRCIAGALSVEDYKAKLTAAGFESVEVEPVHRHRVSEMVQSGYGSMIERLTPEERESIDGRIMSAFIRATKGAAGASQEKGFPGAQNSISDKDQSMQDIREQVKQRYAKEAVAASEDTKASCCSSSCCREGDMLDAAKDFICGDLYSESDLKDMPLPAFLASLGCGNPTALAELKSGETVLDLGSGGGIDVLLSAKRVGRTGFVYGLDMTDEMLALAERNRETAGATNVRFLKGTIEEIPLPEESVDVIISNCVINLSADKDRVLAEAFRVLKPSGRFAVSDMVLNGELPESVKKDVLAWSGCVAGALQIAEYRAKLDGAGFRDVDIIDTRVHHIEDIVAAGFDVAGKLTEEERVALDGKLRSAFIRARKP